MSSFIEFYGNNAISPVRQDISDLTRHFERRSGLYRQLGILPGLVTGSSVLEIGPGSGHNSVYTASLAPARYHLVEANLQGIKEMRELFTQYPEYTGCCELIRSRAEQYAPGQQYDLVLCEGMLPALSDPRGVLRHISGLVKPGGVLVITCIDAISGASETLRNLVAHLLVGGESEVQKQLSILLPVFSPHLDTLVGMSRRHDDWVLDNVINPVGIPETLSMAAVLEELGTDFEAYGSSPHFLSDWRWYKQIVGPERSNNAAAAQAYWENVHNFLDYRTLYPARPSAENRLLYALFDAFRIQVRELRESGDAALLGEIERLLGQMVTAVGGISNQLALPFAEVLELVRQRTPDRESVAQSPAFAGYFGRGQQYFSLTRNSVSY